MKRILYCLMAMLVAFVLVNPANATLITRGTGTSTHGTFNLIYDTDLDITWYDYTNISGNWSTQDTWAGVLSVTFDGDTFDDWRLPTTVDGPRVVDFDGTSTAGYNITSSEMGHLFSTELGNIGETSPTGVFQPSGWGLDNIGDFENFETSDVYWSGTERGTTTQHWYYDFAHGYQDTSGNFSHFAMAVRDGDVIPEPTTVALLGIGLAGLAGAEVRRRRKKKAVDKS